jgi:hypothetical protein
MQLDLDIYRMWETPASVCGELWMRDRSWLYTLEPSRETPVHPGHPCIAAGRFRVILSKSPHLGYICPEVLDVPGRTAIRWHIGNKPADVLGCTAVGESHDTDFVGDSKVAFARLMRVLVNYELIYVTYHDGPPPAEQETVTDGNKRAEATGASGSVPTSDLGANVSESGSRVGYATAAPDRASI